MNTHRYITLTEDLKRANTMYESRCHPESEVITALQTWYNHYDTYIGLSSGRDTFTQCKLNYYNPENRIALQNVSMVQWLFHTAETCLSRLCQQEVHTALSEPCRYCA